MRHKKIYSTPALKTIVVYPLGPTLETISLAIASDDDPATTGGDVKEDRPFSAGGGKSRNLWDEVW